MPKGVYKHQLASEETKLRMSISAKMHNKQDCSCASCMSIRGEQSGKHNGAYGRKHTQTERQKMRGRKVTAENKKLHSQVMKKHWEDPKYPWNDPQFRVSIERKAAKANGTKPNSSEFALLRILKAHISDDVEYVGDGTLWFASKNPDFVYRKENLIIELLGCYWHGCQVCFPGNSMKDDFNDRVEVFKSFGYQTLGIWEHELKNISKVTSRIHAFIDKDNG